MDANTNITFEQMPQALAEVLSLVRLIKEAVMNGDNSRHAGRGSHVLVDIERACEITGRLGQFNDRVKVLLGRQVIAFPTSVPAQPASVGGRRQRTIPCWTSPCPTTWRRTPPRSSGRWAPIWRTGWWRRGEMIGRQ